MRTAKVKNNQKGLSMIALIVIILVLVVIASVIFGIATKDNETEIKTENPKNETSNVKPDEKEEEKEPELIIPAGHEHSYDIVVKTTEATCTEPGKTFLKCECGSESVRLAEASLGHEWNAGQVTKVATCQEEGQMTYTCSKCSETRNETLASTLHDFTNRTTTEEYLANEANCTTSATYYYKCQNCDEHGENTFTNGEALGHNWDKGEITTEPTSKKEGVQTFTCTVCEEKRTQSIPTID